MRRCGDFRWNYFNFVSSPPPADRASNRLNDSAVTMANDDDTADDVPAPKRLRTKLGDVSSFTSRPLTIIAGAQTPEGSKTFYGYVEILSKHSEFFAAALRNGWEGSEERVVNLPEHTPDSFEIFLCFIYHGEIRSRSPPDSDDLEDSEEDYRLQCSWALGEKLACTAFQDAVMDALTSKLTKLASAPTDWHEIAYQFTSTPNAFRRLTVDIAAWEWSSVCLEEISAKPAKHSGFLLELASRLLDLSLEQHKAEAPYFGETGCRYHEHVKRGLPCYKTLHHGQQYRHGGIRKDASRHELVSGLSEMLGNASQVMTLVQSKRMDECKEVSAATPSSKLTM